MSEISEIEIKSMTKEQNYMRGYEDGKSDILEKLEKIRTEIEWIAKDYDKFNDYRRVRGLWIALEIIDKYRNEVNE